MSKQFVVAQAGSTSSSSTAAPVQIIKVIKPEAGHTEIFHASYDGTVKIDFTAIANEKITLYHDQTDQTLHIIFTDGAQAIIEPFFDSMGVLSNMMIEVAPNQDLTGAQFATQFPITTDQAVLPAAGPGTPGTPASGADFQPVSVPPLETPPPLPLLPPEELPPIQFHNVEGVVLPGTISPTPPPPPTVVVGVPQAPTVIATADTLVLDESRPVGSDTAGGAAPAGLATTTANFADNFSTPPNFGSDGPLGGTAASGTSYALVLTGTNVASGLYALDNTDTTAGDGDGIGQGAQILLNQSGNTITGSVGATNYFTISIDPSTGIVTFTQLNNIWHSDTTNPDDLATLTLSNANLLQVVQTLTDADGDHASTPLNLGTGVFTIQDSGPTASTVTGTTDTLVLDESRPVGTDTTVHTDPLGLATVTANFSDNFTGGSFGTDGAGSTVYTLKLTGSNVASGLFALDATDTTAGDGDGIGQGTQIVLNQSGDVDHRLGRRHHLLHHQHQSIDRRGDVHAGQQHLALGHHQPRRPGDADGGGRRATDRADIDGCRRRSRFDADRSGHGCVHIQDSGPTASTVTGTTDTLVLDESRPVGTDTTVHTDPLGLATVTANFSDNFTGGSLGTDGAGSTVYTLKLTGSNVASGLFALDATDTTTGDGDGIGQGTQIVLNQSGDVITGSVGATTYFTISINETTGVVTFTQVNNIWHSDTTNPDDLATLTAAAGVLQIVQTLTDADGDHVSTPIDLGTGVFTIQDCWPGGGQGDRDHGTGSGRVASGGQRHHGAH